MRPKAWLPVLAELAGLVSACLCPAAGTDADLPFAGTSARWIGPTGLADVPMRTNLVGRRIEPILPKDCPRFRRRFDLPDGELRSARVTVLGLGGYELWLNGRKVEDERMMAPGWANPEVRLLADAYEVRGNLKPGAANAIGVWLSPGYSDDYNAWGWRWLKPKKLILRLEADYADGRRFELCSDRTWEWTSEQPIAAASLYGGETYDARRADPRWACPDGSTAAWRPVAEATPERVPVELNRGPRVVCGEPRAPVARTKDGEGRWRLDFGVNRAGLVGFTARLPKGARVTVRCAEERKDGRLDMNRHHGAAQTDVYVAAGTGEETYRPRFTYHGFRYAEIEGLPDEALPSVRAWAVSSELRERTDFRCSDPTLNWLWEAAKRTMRGNFMSYPSDCFTRGERTPCLMDSMAYEDTALAVFEMRDYYARWLHDAARYELGVDPVKGDNDNPDWASEPIVLAERLLKRYGRLPCHDREYPRLREIARSFADRSPDGLWKTGFGDWCAPNPHGSYQAAYRSVGLVTSAWLCECFRAFGALAAALGKTEDAAWAETQRMRCRAAFLAAHYHRESRSFGDGRQTEQVLPLAFGLVPEEDRPAVVKTLERRIRETDGRLDTGIFGTRYLGDVLLENGLGDLWLELVRGPKWPSFGYIRAQGSTTLWEQWVRDGSMASHAHSMFAGAVSCLVTHLAGIRSIDRERRTVRIAPCCPDGLDSVEATVALPEGRLRVSWRRERGRVALDVDLPEGYVRTPEGTRP